MGKRDKNIDVILKNSERALREEMEIYSYDDDDYEERRRRQAAKKKKRKRHTGIKIAVLITEILVILLLSFAVVLLVMPNSKVWLLSTPFGKFFVRMAFSEETYNNVRDEEFDRNNTGINENLDTSKLDEYMNIALFGLDSRDGNLGIGNNSDCMMLVSINKETKKVKMASIYRDTYLRVFDGSGNFGYKKVNSAYCLGGASSAVKTMNTNFDLNIKDYITINFEGMEEIIDLLGGLDIKMTKSEAHWVNRYVNQYYKESGQPGLSGTNNIEERAGTFHLNGIQATAYCRIRYVAIYFDDGTSENYDFGRTARQRLVLNKIIEKAKNLGVDKVMDLADAVFKDENKFFQTSIPYDDIIDLLPVVLEFTLDKTEAYPKKYAEYGGSDLVPDNLAQTVVDMHNYLFDDDDYKPSKTVLGINETLCSLLGLDTTYEN